MLQLVMGPTDHSLYLWKVRYIFYHITVKCTLITEMAARISLISRVSASKNFKHDPDENDWKTRTFSNNCLLIIVTKKLTFYYLVLKFQKYFLTIKPVKGMTIPSNFKKMDG